MDSTGEDIILVKKLKSQGSHKTLMLNNGMSYQLPTSSCIDKSNEIIVNEAELFIKCKNGITQIYPTYCKKDIAKIGDFSMEFLIKEITDEDELKSYKSLSQFHYKGQSLFGRTSILIAVSSTPYLPKVLGYIELATPFYVNKPRSEVLNSQFKHNGISWENWDKETTKKYINSIVRIARCVIYPEFRGVGLGQILIEHAIIFAKTRWQIINLKPLFIEISADMLRYVPFAEKAGMHYIGETEGNLNRIHKDLAYLLKNHQRIVNKEIVSKHQMGIVEQQKARVRKALKIIHENNLTIDEFLLKLEQLSQNKRLKDYAFFNDITSLPKPTYLMGLDEISELFLINQLNNNPQLIDDFYEKIRVEPIESSIKLDELSISYSSVVRRTQKTQAIHNAFSISPTDIESTIINKLSFQIKPGEIVFIIGSSGAGKTTLINFLSQTLNSEKIANVHGNSAFPKNYSPGIFAEIQSSKPLIEIFGNFDINYALQIMGTVGLSDAYVYLKRYGELSKGQQFRAKLAQLIHSKKNVIIIDEFCSNLDPVTSNVISSRLHKLVKKLGITLIVGAAHCENFIHSLNPDKVLRLSTAWEYEEISGKEFASYYAKKQNKLNFQTIRFTSGDLALFLTGKKKTFLQKNFSNYKIGRILIETPDDLSIAYIYRIDKKNVSTLTVEDANENGFATLEEFDFYLRQEDLCSDESLLFSIHYLRSLNFNVKID